VYHRHSGYPAAARGQGAEVRAVRPVRMVEEAIRGMLPKTKLGKQMYRKLKCMRATSIHTTPSSPNLAATSAVDGAADRTEEQEWL